MRAIRERVARPLIDIEEPELAVSGTEGQVATTDLFRDQIRNEGSPPSMRFAHQFQGQKVKGQGHQTHCKSLFTNNAEAHIVRHIFRTAKPTKFKLGTRMEYDDSHQPQAPRPPTSKVMIARSRDQSEPSWPNAEPVSLAAGGGIQCRSNPAATLVVHKSNDRPNPTRTKPPRS